MENQAKEKPPTIEVQLKNGQYIFWCPHCRAKHYHGAGDGHRTAHCTNSNSPYRKTGYYVVHKDPKFVARRPPKNAQA
jgi:hypothetical protein